MSAIYPSDCFCDEGGQGVYRDGRGSLTAGGKSQGVWFKGPAGEGENRVLNFVADTPLQTLEAQPCGWMPRAGVRTAGDQNVIRDQAQ